MYNELYEEYEELRDRLIDLPTQEEIDEYFYMCKGQVFNTAHRINHLLPEVLRYCEEAFDKIPFKAPDNFPLPELPYKTGQKKMDFILLAYWLLQESRAFTLDYLHGQEEDAIKDDVHRDYLSSLRYGYARLSSIRRQYALWPWEDESPFRE